jgi:Tfp pilus assembly protein PilW
MLSGRRSAAAGFSLVELMVALVAGLVLLGSVLALVAANMQNNSLVIRDMRVTQESRALTSVMVRELRRNGYVGDAMRMIGAGFTNTDFPDVQVLSASCIAYAYDADSDGAMDAGERRLFSRGVTAGQGAIFRKLTTSAGATFTAADCGTGTRISSDDIDVQCLGFVAPDGSAITSDSAEACYDAAAKPSPAIVIPHPGDSVYLALRVGLVGATDSSRRTEAQISVRSPEIVASP